MSVKRYDLIKNEEYSADEGVMHERSNGDWVKFDDFEAVQDEVNRLTEIITDTRSSLEEAIQYIKKA